MLLNMTVLITYYVSVFTQNSIHFFKVFNELILYHLVYPLVF